MTVHTANGASVGVGEAFLMTSSSAMPSGWAYDAGTTSIQVTNGQSWVAIFNSFVQSSTFGVGLAQTITSGFFRYNFWQFSGATEGNGQNLGNYLPAFFIRIS